MLADVRYALRMLVKAPGFTAIALLTLALGIGANAAIFTLVDATMLRPLPVPHPEQLVLLTNPSAIGTSYGLSGGNRPELAYSEYTNLRDHNAVFTSLLASQSGADRHLIDWGRGAEPVQTKLVSGNYFSTLGINAVRGRDFTEADEQAVGSAAYAVLSYGYWTQHFHRDDAALGKTFRFLGHVYTVIGVMPAGFNGEDVGQEPDVYLPISMANQAFTGADMLHDGPGVSRIMWLQVMGRLRPGVSVAQAQAACNVVFRQSLEEQAHAASDAGQRRDIMSQKLSLSSGATGTSGVRAQFSDALLAVFALVGMVLLLAIVNLASLLLARATARQKEIAVRAALGARRSRILRQLLTESVLLAVIGGLLGAWLAIWGVRVLVNLVAGGGSPILLNLSPDLCVVGFIIAITVLAGVLFGLAPGLRMSRLDLNAILQAQGRGGSARTRRVLGRVVRGGLPLGKLLIIAQVALAVVLLVGAGLFVRNLQKLADAPLGFDRNQLVQFSIAASQVGYKGPAAAAFLRNIEDRVRSTPGVRAVGLSQLGLFQGSDMGLPVSVPGFTAANPDDNGSGFDQVSPGFFGAAGIPIIAGRNLTDADESGVQDIVINQAFQRHFFPHDSPLGQHVQDLYPDDKRAEYTIVGICGDAKENSLGEKLEPRFYLPIFNGIPVLPVGAAVVVVRGGSAGDLRKAVQAAAPSLPPPPMQTMTELLDGSLATENLLAKLSGFFGLLALFLAVIGLYGVMSYGVARRAPEIGVRMALGAGRGSVLRMILGEVTVILVLGLALGLPASLAGARILANRIHLFGISFYDPTSVAGAAAMLLLAALLAGWLPAHRASRVDPLLAMRQE
ncbi:MAG TPA: ABC transporter permease [Terriglobales bacterium]|nr:ABC transporter permease [Terriglobales bacterium]